VAAGPIIVALVGGLALGTAAGIWFDVGALGSVRPMAPGPIRGLVVASALGVVAIALSTVVVVLVLAVRTARSVATPPPRGRGATDVPGGARPDGERRPVAHRWLLARSPAAARGLRMAASHRTSGPAVAGAGVLSALMVATVVFGASLVALLDEPRSYGWPWDVAATINGGYYGPSAEEADAVFGSDPDVARWTGMVPVTDVALDATAVGAVAGLDRTSHVDLPVIEGSLPVGRDEVAIGSTTARVLGLGVDDQVELTRRGIPGHRVTVTGIVVLPTVRALNADGVSAGTGVLLPEAALPDDGSWTVSFIGLSLRDADDAAAVERLLGRLGPQPGTTDFVFTYSEPVAPPEVLDARATLGLPVAVAGVFGLATAAGLAATSWASSHARRSELAVLRALGFTTGQVRSTVRAHALVTASMVVAVGVPVGVILGRVLWRAYAVRLGVATDPSSPLVLVLLTSLAIIVIALVVAEPIARRAATVTSGVRPQT